MADIINNDLIRLFPVDAHGHNYTGQPLIECSWFLHVHLEGTFLLIYDQPNMLDRWDSRDLLWHDWWRPTQIQWFAGRMALGRAALCPWCRGRSSLFPNPAGREEGLVKHHHELVISSGCSLVMEACCYCCWWLWSSIKPPPLLQANSQRGRSTSVPEGDANEVTLHQALSPFIQPFTKMLPYLIAGGWANSICF